MCLSFVMSFFLIQVHLYIHDIPIMHFNICLDFNLRLSEAPSSLTHQVNGKKLRKLLQMSDEKSEIAKFWKEWVCILMISFLSVFTVCVQIRDTATWKPRYLCINHHFLWGQCRIASRCHGNKLSVACVSLLFIILLIPKKKTELSLWKIIKK